MVRMPSGWRHRRIPGRRIGPGGDRVHRSRCRDPLSASPGVSRRSCGADRTRSHRPTRAAALPCDVPSQWTPRGWQTRSGQPAFGSVLEIECSRLCFRTSECFVRATDQTKKTSGLTSDVFHNSHPLPWKIKRVTPSPNLLLHFKSARSHLQRPVSGHRHAFAHTPIPRRDTPAHLPRPAPQLRPAVRQTRTKPLR